MTENTENETTTSELIAKKQKHKEKMNVRDYITLAVMLVLVLLIYTFLGTPFGTNAVTNLYIFAVCAIPWGIVLMLLYTKVNKKGVVLSSGIILSLLQLMNFWVVSIFIFVGTIIAHVLWTKFDRKRFSTMAICYTIQISFWYLATPISLVLLWDLMKAQLSPDIALLYEAVIPYALGPSFLLSALATVGGCLLGAYLGKVLLKKHFVKAGIV
jgi:energy-coupling factor transport system substrate-specific component